MNCHQNALRFDIISDWTLISSYCWSLGYVASQADNHQKDGFVHQRLKQLEGNFFHSGTTKHT